jgi:ADP-ribose pyrophosphatase
MSFSLLHSETIYQGRAFAVRRDEVRLPDGKTAQLDIVAHSGAVTLVPVDEQGRIWFVRQYRHAAGERLLELPAGTLEPAEAPEVCAARELREEIGMAAGALQKLGESFLAPGYSTEMMHFFLATDLQHAPLAHDSDEFLNVEHIPIARAFELAHAGQLRDAKSLAALLLARPYLPKVQV